MRRNLTKESTRFQDIFTTKTLKNLTARSAESFRQIMHMEEEDINRLVKVIHEIEKPVRGELELLAVVMVKEAYGIVDSNKIKIEARIVDNLGQTKMEPPEENLPDSSNDFSEPESDLLAIKRRIINSITQGGAVRGSMLFKLFKEYLDDIDPTLVSRYGKILEYTFGVYDDEQHIAAMLAAVAKGGSLAAGESEGYYDEEQNTFVVKAQGINFAVLVHEIIKGVYEIVAVEGFTQDPEQNQRLIKQVDKIENEPEDLRFGKYIFDEINALVQTFADSPDNRVREYFIAEIYKLPEAEFIRFVENLLNNELTNKETNWAADAIESIEADLKKDDTGLTGLDYKPEEDDPDDSYV